MLLNQFFSRNDSYLGKEWIFSCCMCCSCFIDRLKEWSSSAHGCHKLALALLKQTFLQSFKFPHPFRAGSASHLIFCLLSVPAVREFNKPYTWICPRKDGFGAALSFSDSDSSHLENLFIFLDNFFCTHTVVTANYALLSYYSGKCLSMALKLSWMHGWAEIYKIVSFSMRSQDWLMACNFYRCRPSFICLMALELLDIVESCYLALCYDLKGWIIL